MTTEQLRTEIIQGLDALENRPLVWNIMSKDQQRLVRAERNFWQQADVAVLQKLLDLVNKEP